METNRLVTLPSQYENLKKTGRIDAWKLSARRQRHIFHDSDAAKWMEAAAYSLATHPDKRLERKTDRIIALMEKAQMPDGYLNSYYASVNPDKRWTNLRDNHELYCAGHLMEAAAAYHEATGKRRMLDLLRRFADHIGEVFGPGKGQLRGYPGHEEIELALVKLYRSAGEKRYLKLARFFVNERGKEPHYFSAESRKRGEAPGRWNKSVRFCQENAQAHEPVREQRKAVGHAVRAVYLYCGMADLALETEDKKLAAACKRLWKNVTRKRMAITGGIGATRAFEMFTFDYDQPDETAYNETCASIAMVFWARRMLRIDPKGEYADVMERALYNGVLSGISLDGKRYFYANPLAAHPWVSPRQDGLPEEKHYRRSEWFGCACCPPNIARLLASLGGYAYSSGGGEIRVHLYLDGEAEFKLDQDKVRLEVKTDYPWKEKIHISVRPEKSCKFTLSLRLPGWSRGHRLKINGKPEPLRPLNGYVKIKRDWLNGDTAELTIPMPVQMAFAHPSSRQTAGRVALLRGPLVYCLEEADNGKGLHNIILPPQPAFKTRRDKKALGGVPLITTAARREESGGWGGSLYRSGPARTKAVKIKAIPYHLWANRQPGEMRVWIRRQE